MVRGRDEEYSCELQLYVPGRRMDALDLPLRVTFADIIV